MTNFFGKKKLDFNSIISNSPKSNLTQFLVDLLTQLTLTELLKQLEVKCHKVMAKSFGNFSSAYFENGLSLNEFLECVYAVAKITNETEINENVNGINIEGFTKYSKCISVPNSPCFFNYYLFQDRNY